VIGDGAPWIWNIADEQFYEATKIVDLYHAREHYWNVAKSCFGQRNVVKNWMMADRKRLLMPSNVAHPSQDMISGYVKGRSVILRRTRFGCGMLISEKEVSLWALVSWRQGAELSLGSG
jgi:hypothetical protein